MAISFSSLFFLSCSSACIFLISIYIFSYNPYLFYRNIRERS
jgi:hypothetical protein